jgi:hypothetical protein
MKAIKLLFLLFVLLLPFGSGATAFNDIELPSHAVVGSETLFESHRLAGIVPENLIEYTVTEISPEEVSVSKGPGNYFFKKNSDILYHSEFESLTGLLSDKFKNLIIPSLDTFTLIFPFHSFL